MELEHMGKIMTVLILAPHTDDGEFGCGGTVAKLIERGIKVTYVAFSSCDESLPKELPKDTLIREVGEATAKLEIARDNLILFDFKVRKFPEFRQPILEEMIRLNSELAPHLVFLPCPNDTHQDHNVISSEGFRAFKRTTILGYEIPWNNLTFTTNAFVHLEERHLARKIEALRCYKSQADRSYAREEFIRSLAIARGTQIGHAYAEAFEVIRWIIQ